MTGIEETAAVIAAGAAVASAGVGAYAAATPPPKPKQPKPLPASLTAPPQTMPDPNDLVAKRRAQQRAVTEAQGGRLSTMLSQDSGAPIQTLGG